MATASAYVNEIKSIDNELARLRVRIKELNQQKNLAQSRFYAYCTKHNIEELNGIKVAKCAPKQSVPRKTEKQKKRDIVEKFREIGVQDPESFYKEIKSLQKVDPKLA